MCDDLDLTCGSILFFCTVAEIRKCNRSPQQVSAVGPLWIGRDTVCEYPPHHQLSNDPSVQCSRLRAGWSPEQLQKYIACGQLLPSSACWALLCSPIQRQHIATEDNLLFIDADEAESHELPVQAIHKAAAASIRLLGTLPQPEPATAMEHATEAVWKASLLDLMTSYTG